MDWNIGGKMYNFIRSFLTNGKLMVSVNHSLSRTMPLNNGIPQGIPVDDLSRTLFRNKKIEHCMYADHLYIIAKSQDNGNINHELSNSIHLINNWPEISGASISYEKKQYICIYLTKETVILLILRIITTQLKNSRYLYRSEI